MVNAVQFDANICAIVVGVIQVTGTSISVLVVDKFGRRKLLMLSELFICFAFCMLGSFFLVQVSPFLMLPHDTTLLPGALHHPHLRPGLAAPGQHRHLRRGLLHGHGAAALGHERRAVLQGGPGHLRLTLRLLQLGLLLPRGQGNEGELRHASHCVSPQFSPTLEAMIGASGSYLSFAVLALAGTLLIAALVPETRGRTEEQIQTNFRARDAAADTERAVKYIQINSHSIVDTTAS